MTDCTGRKANVGDKVIYTDSDSAGLMYGEIVKVTDARVKILGNWSGYPLEQKTDTRSRIETKDLRQFYIIN